MFCCHKNNNFISNLSRFKKQTKKKGKNVFEQEEKFVDICTTNHQIINLDYCPQFYNL